MKKMNQSKTFTPLDQSNLSLGDLSKIARACKCNYNTVQAIIKGYRNPNTKTGRLIISAYKQVLKDNAELIALCDQIRQNAIEDVNPALYGKENYSNSFQEL